MPPPNTLTPARHCRVAMTVCVALAWSLRHVLALVCLLLSLALAPAISHLATTSMERHLRYPACMHTCLLALTSFRSVQLDARVTSSRCVALLPNTFALVSDAQSPLTQCACTCGSCYLRRVPHCFSTMPLLLVGMTENMKFKIEHSPNCEVTCHTYGPHG